MTTTADRLARVFDDMSKARDTPSNTTTTGSIRAVDGGYVQEIESRSSPRPRYGHGDHVETVTRRSVKSVSSPERGREASSVAQVTSSAGARFAYRGGGSGATTPTSSQHGERAVPFPTSAAVHDDAPQMGSARSLRVNDPSPPTAPVNYGSQYDERASAASGSRVSGVVVPPGATAVPTSFRVVDQAAASSRPLPQPRSNSTHSNNSNSNGSGAVPVGTWRTLGTPRQPQSVPQYAASSASSTTATITTTEIRDDAPTSALRRGRDTRSRSLNFGGTDTRLIEPSRVTPLRVDREYAPVKYVSRRELRRLREQHQGATHGLSGMVRKSSVPRLDALLHEERMEALRRGRSASSASSATGARAARGADFASPEEVAFRSQRPISSDPYAAASPPPHQPSYEASPPARQFWGPNGPGGAPPQMMASPSGGSVRRSSSAPNYPAAVQQMPRHHPGLVESPSLAGSRYDEDDDRVSVSSQRSRSSVVTAASLHAEAPNAPTLIDFAQMLCNARGIARPPAPPAYAAEAFRLVSAGTYLIKYGRTGPPHERWVALRIQRDDANRAQPYLVWAVHKDAATIKDRLNTAFLFDVSTGPTGPNFDRHFVGPDALRGPHVGSKPSTLPVDFALRFHFQSVDAGRSIDVLALDDQTFRCWLLVMRYLADINRSANGHQAPTGVDPMPAESVRSGSTASHR